MNLYDLPGADMPRTDADYLKLAENHPAWVQTRASFALEGITLDERMQILIGRQIVGDATLDDVLMEILKAHGVDPAHSTTNEG